MTSKKLNLVSILVALKKIRKVKLIESTEFFSLILICGITKEKIDFSYSIIKKYVFCFS